MGTQSYKCKENGFEVEILGEYDEEDKSPQVAPESQLMQLSLYSFLGMDSPTTMKVRGRVGNTSMVILIDSGVTHNFVSPVFAKKAHLTTIMSSRLQILLGTGILAQGLGICKNVPVQKQGLEFVLDCIALELCGVDLILGVQWLRTLGKCEIDWELQEWSFV